MLWTVIHYIDIALWLLVAASTAYVFFFAVISLFYSKDENYTYNRSPHLVGSEMNRFLVLYPAYNEDRVIINSVEQFIDQDYPQELYTLVVISDHMQPETNHQLAQYPIELLQPTFEKSSKAKAMQYAIEFIEGNHSNSSASGNHHSNLKTSAVSQERATDSYDFIVILDADNVVQSTFLSQLNVLCNSGYEAIQCHRCAKNANNDVAVLDGVSEEINNTIFRKAHNRIGLSSALIGSGMCFNYDLFRKNVFQLSTAGEDRELEALLLRQNVFIKYAADIHVFDEKVSSQDNFERQRMRWMTAQVQSLLNMLPSVPRALIHGNINFVDKTVQQALIPRSMLIVILGLMAVLTTVLVPVWCPKWWVLFACLAVSLFIAIPAPLRFRSFSKVLAVPGLVMRMIRNILHMDRKNTDFIHTEHDK
jgi:cellulose synthase/poly-beta-1,6-N-acetylglucosamine synthase-like glycosyltransferase